MKSFDYSVLSVWSCQVFLFYYNWAVGQFDCVVFDTPGGRGRGLAGLSRRPRQTSTSEGLGGL